MSSPKLIKENKMGLKALVGKKITKNVKFMSEDVKISKLTVSEVLEIQNKAKELEGNDAGSMDILRLVIRASVEGGDELTDQDFESFPMDELSKLSNEIMKFSGVISEGK